MERFDVVVVGAGPAGSVAARFAAEGGARTLLLDRREELGHPVQCGEFLPAAHELTDLFPCPEAIGAAYDVPPESVLKTTSAMRCIAPTGRRYDFPLDGFVVSRRSFDKQLALRAEGAGAVLRHPAGVTAVAGDEVRLASGERVPAKVVIGADGPVSTVARSVGFSVPRTMYRMITASAAGAFDERIDLYFGRVAPGGYAWVFPRATDANIGLGVAELPADGSLDRLLEEFARAGGLGRPTDRTRWWVPIGPPPRSAVVGRTLFAGDAANLVMATNGGGIPTAILSGYWAGSVAAAHVTRGTELTEYDRLWRPALFAPLARAHRLKRIGDQLVAYDWLLALGMRYLGTSGLDAMVRLKWPARLGGIA
ncbi:MAG TPA: geranylgeranyl reductase family protein [Thermoplasmata archaeon]|nr:geranylgeranyl reductase family protein [Thermoplasmata archaeon]